MSETITQGSTVITPDLVDGYTATNAGQNVIHIILGRSNPDITLRPPLLRSGTLDLFFTTEAKAKAAADAFMVPAVFALASTDRPSIAMNFVVSPDGSTRELEDTTRELWYVRVGYQEVT